MNRLYEAVWPKLEKRWECAEDNFADGIARLLPQEQQAIALWWLEAECNNGSLSQFFFNSSGEFALSALNGLQRLKLPKTYAALHSAIAYFAGIIPWTANGAWTNCSKSKNNSARMYLTKPMTSSPVERMKIILWTSYWPTWTRSTANAPNCWKRPSET